MSDFTYKSPDILYANNCDLVTITELFDISIYDMLPDDLIFIIMNRLNVKDIFALSRSTKRFQGLIKNPFLIQIIREKITKRTGLPTNQYNLSQLEFINKIQSKRNIYAEISKSIVLTNGNIYKIHTHGKKCITPPGNKIIQIDGSYSLRDDGYVYHNIYGKIEELDNIIQISYGENTLLMLKSDGTVYGLGDNYFGQLGPGDINFHVPTKILGLNNIIQVSTSPEDDQYGLQHSLGLTSDGKVYFFGAIFGTEFGGKDLYDTKIPIVVPGLEDIIQIATGQSLAYALGSNGEVYMFGCPDDTIEITSPKILPVLNDIVEISIKDTTLLALTSKGQVYGYGYNGSGQLGLGDPDNRDIPELIPGLTDIVQISAGYSHSLVLNSKGEVYAFGCNLYGQLGLGDYDDRYEPEIIPNLLI